MKIIVLQGVPACGKSTWAKEFVKDKKDWVIVSRDSIRESTGMYWCPEREDYISNIEVYQIENAVGCGLNVIIDATNLNPKTIKKWEDLAVHTGSELEYKLFEIDFKTAVERDKGRERPVGEKVIKRFFKMYFPEKLVKFIDDRPIAQPNGKIPCVVFDIDGTVALRNGRSPYDLSKVKDDSFDPRMYRLIDILKNKAQIVFVSGREGTVQCKADTTQWLKDNLPSGAAWNLFMRAEKDMRNDAIIKEEIYDTNIEPYWDVICVFDDRDRVVKMWREKGILCNQVYWGDF